MKFACHAGNMKLGILLLVTGWLVTNAFAGSDGFSGIQCGSDIAKALTGKRMSNERIADLEKRHADLGLKDLGASEISERLSCISWLICGSEFMLLQDESIARRPKGFSTFKDRTFVHRHMRNERERKQRYCCCDFG
jgi:hypothetical protein